jgi:hypothetical protein
MGFNNRGFGSDCPCKDCDIHTVTCHVVFRKYNEWKKEKEKENEAKKAANKRYDTMSEAKQKAIWKKMRYNRRGPKNTHR